LVHAPELATVVLLEHALSVAVDALLAEHMTLIDDFRSPRERGPTTFLAHMICRRAASLSEALWRYRRAVREADSQAPQEPSDDNSF
jgi:hypothetical protein